MSRAFRIAARAAWRAGADLLRGGRWRVVRSTADRRATGVTLPARLVERQAIRRTELWENKVHNLRRGGARIEAVAIEPGEVFSFWALVGPPTAARGWLDGRSLVGGRPVASPGGGLCQLSGLLYALALRAGLEIRERHAHSVDLYDAATRFAPLGADATVAWPNRDLRLRNTLGQPICFRLLVGEQACEAWLCARAPVRELAVEHRVVVEAVGEVVVETVRGPAGGRLEPLAVSRYRRPASGAGIPDPGAQGTSG